MIILKTELIKKIDKLIKKINLLKEKNYDRIMSLEILSCDDSIHDTEDLFISIFDVFEVL